MDGPQDLPKKIDIGKHVYKPRKEKGVREGMDPRPGDKKSDETYQPFYGDAPRDPGFWRWGGPTAIAWPNLSTPRCCFPEQGADTGFPQGKVPHSFEQVKHNREEHGVEHERFKRAYHLHLEQVD